MSYDSSIADRFKFIRLHYKLSQIDFASRIGFTQANVSKNEKGQQEVSEPYIKAVMREFNVNETWLRTGVGEPFEKKSNDAQLGEFFGHIMASDESTALKTFMQAVANLGPEYWDQVEVMLSQLHDSIKQK